MIICAGRASANGARRARARCNTLLLTMFDITFLRVSENVIRVMTRSSVASKRVVTRRLNRLVIDHGKVVTARANKHII